MKLRLVVALFLSMALMGYAEEENEPPLPTWSEEDAQRLMQGENMIYGALFQPVDEMELAAPAVKPGDLPEPAADGSDFVDPTSIAESDLEKFFGQKPKTYLIDPQNVLTRQEFRDRLSFLKYHASDSQVGFYVYVFDEQQIIPSSVRIEEIFARDFADAGPTALLFYFMGNPQRSEIHLSPDLMQSVSRSERARALQSSINQAIVKSQAVDQLDGFCVQMSIRIYWMEKAMQSGLIAPIEKEEEISVTPNRMENIAAVKVWWAQWRIPISISIGVILVGIIFTWQRRRRMNYELPQFPVAPRLGGEGGAGVGAVISYASARVPAAAQREQVPDFSRR